MGYLKPLIDLTFLRRHGDLAIGRRCASARTTTSCCNCLLEGRATGLPASIGYFYRKHANSVSHRTAASDVERLIEADAAMLASLQAPPRSLARACKVRRRSLERALAYSQLIDALKSRNWAAAVRLAVRHPSALPLMRMPIAARAETTAAEAAAAHVFQSRKTGVLDCSPARCRPYERQLHVSAELVRGTPREWISHLFDLSEPGDIRTMAGALPPA